VSVCPGAGGAGSPGARFPGEIAAAGGAAAGAGAGATAGVVVRSQPKQWSI